MGKLASFIKNTLLGTISLLLAHLSYELYKMTFKLAIVCDEINEMNGLIRNLFEIMKAIAKKWRIQIP